MATATKVLSLAASQLGYVESEGNVTKYWRDLIAWHKASSSYQGQPWCAAFVQWCLYKNGMWFSASYPYYCPSIESAARSRGQWHSTPRAGDLVLFSFGYNEAVHVGFVEKVLDASRIQTIEGNTSSGSGGSQTNGGGVYRRIRSRTWGVRGYARPTYSTYVASSTPTSLTKLTVDGVLGPATIKRWQQVNGTTVDGVISTPSELVKSVQRFLNKHGANLTVDGYGIQPNTSRSYGPTNTVKALQRYYGVSADGVLSYPSSACVKALQRALNG